MVNGRRRLGTMPRKLRPVAFTPRDTFVCRALAKARVMRTSDFVPLVFPSLPIARRRLLKLMDAGVVVGVVHMLHEDTRWQLGAKARELLGSDDHAPRPRSLRQLGEAGGGHHFALVRFWALLAHACFTSSTVKLRRFRFEWEAEGDHVNTTSAPRPDARFTLEVGGVVRTFWLEIDCGTESVPYVVREKVSVFERVSSASSAPETLLLTVPTATRLAAIAGAVPSLAAPALATVFTASATTLSLTIGWTRLGRAGGETGLVAEGM